ncbi:rCG35172, partial [Rattus norvegicus]
MKMCKSSRPEEVKKRKKVVLFCPSEVETIIPEEGKEMLVADVGPTVNDPLLHFCQDAARQGLTGATLSRMQPRRARRTNLLFNFWAPESAPLQSKMICASSKDAIKKNLTGIKHELQANCFEEEVKACCTLAEKLGGIFLEHKPL